MLVNGFWHKGDLSLMAKLTIHSFVDNGYAFRLWTYTPNELSLQVPVGVSVEDANLIVPEFRMTSEFSSELFKMAFLFDEGGLFVDMDVTCLKRFDFSKYNYVFRPHYKYFLSSSIIKCLKKSTIPRDCFYDLDNADNITLDFSYDKLKYHVLKSKGECDIAPVSIFGDDSETTLVKTLYGGIGFKHDELTKNLFLIHWNIESFPELNFDSPIYKTTYKNLLKQYDVLK